MQLSKSWSRPSAAKSRCTHTQPRGSLLARYALPASIVLLVLVCLRPVLDNDFVNWDDLYYFTGNRNFRGLSAAHLRWMFTTLYMGHYQPLSWLSHGLVYSVWGLNPLGYHLGNLVLHAANAVLVYLLTAALLRRVWHADTSTMGISASAAVGALVFALHPLRVEAVAWATERQEVLCALFSLLAVLTYLRMQEVGCSRAGRWHALSVCCFGLSLLSKATGIMLPIVLLILDAYPLRRIALTRPVVRTLLIEKLPYAVLALGAATLVFLAKQPGSMATLAEHGVTARAVQALYGIGFYVWKTAVPRRLSPLYLLEKPFNPLTPGYLLCGVAVTLLTVLLIAVRRRYPWLLAAWACYVVIVSPVLGLVQAGPQLVADRYTYLSCLPWAVLAGAAVYRLWLACEECRLSMWAGSAVGMGIAAVLAVLGVQSHEQACVWKDSLTLWSHVLRVDPSNYIAYNGRGDARLVPSASPSACHVEGDLAGAVADYSQAVRFAPPGAHYRSTFEGNLAAARQQLAVCGLHQQETAPHGAE